MKILAYLLYGSKPEYVAELTFSILTALRWVSDRDELQIVVLTDQQDALRALPVRIVALAAEKMREWTRGGSYMHRAKPLALLQLLTEFGAPTALIDTDTWFKADPLKLFERIGPGRSLLHDSDGYRVGDKEEWRPVIAAGLVAAETEMLNSGVVGVDASNAQLMERSVELIDQIRAIALIFNAEQLALAAALQSGSKIGFSADLVVHYWGYLRLFLVLEIRRFLSANAGKSVSELVAASATVCVDLPSKRLFDRALAKGLKRLRGWSSGYGYAFLCYRTALAYAEKDPEVASLWIASTLHALKQEGAIPGSQRRAMNRDFSALRADRLNRAAWLDAKVKDEWRSLMG